MKPWFYLKSKVLYVKLYTYETIPLRLFMEIAEDGNLKRLIIKGKLNKEELMLAFEDIIRRNGEVNGSFQYLTFFQLLKSYAKFIAEYTVVKALLIKLAFVIDYKSIQEVRSRGYAIDLTNTAKYAESLTAGLRKVGNLITKATMKRKEIERLNVEKEKSESFESILANISFALGFEVKETITLAGYNEYQRILKARVAAQQKAHGRN